MVWFPTGEIHLLSVYIAVYYSDALYLLTSLLD
jgi:hypothetical protein